MGTNWCTKKSHTTSGLDDGVSTLPIMSIVHAMIVSENNGRV